MQHISSQIGLHFLP